MYIKRLSSVGGISSLQRYANMLAGNQTFISTTTTAIALAIQGSPYISAYPWSQGFGTKYSDPASLPSFFGYDISWTPDGNAISLADYYGLSAYAWSSGFGTRYSAPATIPGGVTRSTVFSTAGDTVFAGSRTSPYISAYPWSNASGFGTKYSAPASIPTGGTWGIESMDYGSNTIFMSTDETPYVAAYPWSSGFGTKYSAPATITTYGYGIAYNSTASLVALGRSSISPAVYPWSSGFGTKYADPPFGNYATFGGASVSFNNNGTAIIGAYSYSGELYGWPFSAGFGTRYSTPSTYIGQANDYNGVAVSKDGKIVSIVGSVSPYIFVYYFNTTSGFVFKYANPTTLPTGSVSSAAFR